MNDDQASPVSSPARHVVVTRKSTGLGSDLISAIGAIAYAHKTERDVLIDWRKSRYLADASENLFDRIFEIPGRLDGVGIAAAKGTFSDSELPAPVDIFNERGPDFETFHHEMLRDPAPVNRSVVITRPMHHLPDIASQRQWLSAIRPVPRIRTAIDNFHDTKMKGHPVVGIHIRHGNGEKLGSDRDKLIARGVDGLVALCIQHLRNLDIPPSARIFVCTDSSELREQLASALPNVIHYESRIGGAKSGPIHTQAYGAEGVDDAVAEMWLLARCDWLFYTPSWFSHYARVVGTFATEPVNLDDISLYGTSDLYEKRLQKPKSPLHAVLKALRLRK